MNLKEIEIYEKIKKAIIEQKLKPNVRLIENDLANAFEVSRTPIRNILRRLEYEKLIRIVKNKGAFVAGSTAEEAKEVFEMRRIIESSAIKKACRYSNENELLELESLIKEERKLTDETGSYCKAQLLGDFHVKIAEMGRNSYFVSYLEELISLTNMIVGVYGKSSQFCCSHHENIFEAIQNRDEELAESLVLDHLKEIEEDLYFPGEEGENQLSTIFKL